MALGIKITAAGSAGSAAGTGDSEAPLRGYLERIEYSYSVSPAIPAPATTTITITERDSGDAVLAIAAGNTNGVAYLRAPAVDMSNAAIAGSWTRMYFDGRFLHAAVAASDPGAVITLKFVISESYME